MDYACGKTRQENAPGLKGMTNKQMRDLVMYHLNLTDQQIVAINGPNSIRQKLVKERYGLANVIKKWCLLDEISKCRRILSELSGRSANIGTSILTIGSLIQNDAACVYNGIYMGMEAIIKIGGQDTMNEINIIR